MPHTARHTVLQIYEKKLICGSFPGKKHTQETNVQTILHIVKQQTSIKIMAFIPITYFFCNFANPNFQ